MVFEGPFSTDVGHVPVLIGMHGIVFASSILKATPLWFRMLQWFSFFHVNYPNAHFSVCHFHVNNLISLSPLEAEHLFLSHADLNQLQL